MIVLLFAEFTVIGREVQLSSKSIILFHSHQSPLNKKLDTAFIIVIRLGKEASVI